MKKIITILSGDGIGPEIMKEAIKILKVIANKYNHTFIYQEDLIGSASIKKFGTPLTDETLNKCKNSDAILFGAIGDTKYDLHPISSSIRPEKGLLNLRKKLQLYCNIRPIKYYQELSKLSPIKKKYIQKSDLIIYRELTGGLYFGKKSITQNNAQDICNYSKQEIEKITIKAFQAAKKRKKKLTLVDKSNVLATSKLWRNTVKNIQNKFYQDIKLEYLFIDNAAMQLIINPNQFDIILTENMFGDILSDEASVITGGGIGILPSASIGDKYALFEPIHGSYPQATNKNLANPIGIILSASMLLEYFNMYRESNKIKKAIESSFKNQICTYDINKKNPSTTEEVGEYIARYIIEN